MSKINIFRKVLNSFFVSTLILKELNILAIKKKKKKERSGSVGSSNNLLLEMRNERTASALEGHRTEHGENCI